MGWVSEGRGWVRVRGGAPAALHFSIQYAVKRERKKIKSHGNSTSAAQKARE
jgi:hypothetical protein